MGDVCVSGPYGSDANGPLCLDQTTGSPVNCNDPRCGTGGSGGGGTPQSNTPTYIPQNNPTFATMPFGNSTTTTFTLDSYLSQWVAGVTGQSIASLANQGMGSVSAILAQLSAIAQQYCQVEGPPDCSQIGALVAKYGAMITSAYSNVAASQWNPATFTAYAPSGVVTNPGPAQNPPMPPANPPVAPITPPPVVNPPAAQSNGVNQTTVGSGAGQSNTFNPATLIPDVSSIPSWVWYAGGGVLALVLISSLGKK